MPWRGSHLDDVVVYCIAQYPNLTCSQIVETIHPKDWKNAGKQERGPAGTVPELQYQTMLSRLHRLADQGKICVDNREGSSYHWRIMSPGEREEHERALLAEWACPKKLRRRIEAAAQEMDAEVEFFLSVKPPDKLSRWTGRQEVYAAVVLTLARGEVLGVVKRPEGNAWREAAEEVGLL
jgi:hypothetical protein